MEAELAALLAAHASETTEDGRARLVRHGHLPEREVMMTGIGPVRVKVVAEAVPSVRAAEGDGAGPWRPRQRGQDQVYLIHPAAVPAQGEVGRGVAALALSQGHLDGRFPGGACGLARPERGGAAVDTISRLEADWWDEYERWQRRDLGAWRIVYIRAVANGARTSGAHIGDRLLPVALRKSNAS